MNAKQSVKHPGQSKCSVNGFSHYCHKCQFMTVSGALTLSLALAKWIWGQSWPKISRAASLWIPLYLFSIERLSLFPSFLSLTPISMPVCRVDIFKFVMHFPFYEASIMELIFGWCLTRCLLTALEGEDTLCWGCLKYQDPLNRADELGIPKEISKRGLMEEDPPPGCGGRYQSPISSMLEVSFSSLRFSAHEPESHFLSST